MLSIIKKLIMKCYLATFLLICLLGTNANSFFQEEGKYSILNYDRFHVAEIATPRFSISIRVYRKEIIEHGSRFLKIERSLARV